MALGLNRAVKDMFHRRQLAFVVTVAAIGAVVALSVLRRDDPLDRIRVGMTYEEVKAIMGGPGSPIIMVKTDAGEIRSIPP